MTNKMRNTLWQLTSVLLYYWRSRNLHGLHSPFAYNLVKTVVYGKSKGKNDLKWIEEYRKQLLKNTTQLFEKDLGAGSSAGVKTRTIADFCRSASVRKRKGEFFHRLASFIRPEFALELGTGTGISALYQASGFGQDCRFNTLEGNRILADRATGACSEFGFSNIRVVYGEFQSTLPPILDRLPRLDWVFFDGNHQKKATMDYFAQCLEKATERSVFILDDIRWSSEMYEAWQEVVNHPKVALSIELLTTGLVFFMDRPQKESFIIRSTI